MGSHRKISILGRCNHFLKDLIRCDDKLSQNWKNSMNIKWTLFSQVSETEDFNVKTGTTEQACGQKFYTYILQNISTPTITLITNKTTIHILK